MADRLHIKRNTFANYELGRNAPIDAVVTLICREFGINEVWLRTGEGGEDNMFTKVDADDRYSINLGKLSTTDNEMAQRMVNTIAESSPEELKIIEAFMRKCLGL